MLLWEKLGLEYWIDIVWTQQSFWLRVVCMNENVCVK